MAGVTRKTIITMVDGMHGFPACRVRNISLAEMYAADEVFTTGMGILSLYLCLHNM